MQISKSRLLVVSLLLIIGVQPAVPRNINNQGVFPVDGVKRTPPLHPFYRANPPGRGSFQYVSVPAESNLDEDVTRRSYLGVGDPDIYEWRSRSTSGGYGYYVRKADLVAKYSIPFNAGGFDIPFNGGGFDIPFIGGGFGIGHIPAPNSCSRCYRDTAYGCERDLFQCPEE